MSTNASFDVTDRTSHRERRERIEYALERTLIRSTSSTGESKLASMYYPPSVLLDKSCDGVFCASLTTGMLRLDVPHGVVTVWNVKA